MNGMKNMAGKICFSEVHSRDENEELVCTVK